MAGKRQTAGERQATLTTRVFIMREGMGKEGKKGERLASGDKSIEEKGEGKGGTPSCLFREAVGKRAGIEVS